MSRIISVIFICCLLLFNPTELYASNDIAVFAGGCFWCLEHDLESVPGVINVESGYSGGDLANPTYRNHKGHQESVKVSFDSDKISYETLLRVYWRNIDPFNGEGQFCDIGDSYRPVIFTNGEDQQSTAKKSLKNASKELNLISRDLKVQIKAQKKFWIAEEYHQDYAQINNIKYKFYRYSCGRDNRLKEIWGDNAGKSDPWIY